MLRELLEFTSALLRGDVSKRINNIKDGDLLSQIAVNLNQHADNLLLQSPKGDERTPIDHFLEVVSAFANHDFEQKLPVSEHNTVLDAIAMGINMLGDELEQSVASKAELNRAFNLVVAQNHKLTNFTHIVSHNLRSHTSNISVLIDMLNFHESEEEKKVTMEHLRTSADRLNETILHLNDIVTIQNNKNVVLERLNLHAHVNRVVEILSESVAIKKVLIENKVEKNVYITYNHAYLESIILNLLSNAIKYSCPSRQPRIEVTCNSENEHLIFQVRDNGLGMDLNKYGDKIFGLYKTFHRNKDAKGVGLFITKSQVEAMGGKIEVESKLGEGSAFKVYIS